MAAPANHATPLPLQAGLSSGPAASSPSLAPSGLAAAASGSSMTPTPTTNAPNAANPTSPANGTSAAPTFAVNERVLCYHGPLMYEAKILKTIEFSEKEPCPSTTFAGVHYLVHYKGWKQTWDEWVHPGRLSKLNDQNLALQKSLQAQHTGGSNGNSSAASTKAAKTASSSAAAHHASGTSHAHSSAHHSTAGGRGAGVRKDAHHQGGRGTKRGRDDDDQLRRPEMKLNIPEVLKRKLVDDWEMVTKNFQVVTLPRSPTVAEVLKEFGEWVKEAKPPGLKDPAVLLPTVLSGLQTYFDKSLGTNLLYRFERVQYSQVREKYWTGQKVIVGVSEKEMSMIYGSEHLLRMLVSLPAMIQQTTLDVESMNLIRDYVNELLQYMLREKDRLFQEVYENPGPAYGNVSRS